MGTPNPKQRSAQALQFAVLVLAAGIVTGLLHELGHCLFYWLQGIPAAMSFTKEFPLRDITAHQYAVGSSGGPLMNIFVIIGAYWLFQRYKENPRSANLLSALIVASAFYFILRGLLALLKRSGGELEDAAGLIGLNYLFVVGLFFVLTVTILYLWVTMSGIAVTLKKSVYFLGLFVAYLVMMVIVESIDRRLVWYEFPAIKIHDGRVYNLPPRK